MKTILHLFIGLVLSMIIIVAAGIFLPLENINWGTVRTVSANTIVVTGEARSSEKNQIASFTAGVDSVNDNKDQAVAEVNSKIEALIKAVKDFGIDNADIQTQNLSVYRGEEMYTENGSQRSRPGQWRVNNSINIKLRNIEKASDLTTLLTNSGATNVYGPNFAMEDTKEIQNDLLPIAIENARKKAELMTADTGRKLGKVISINEGGTVGGSYPILMEARGMGGGGSPVEPGSTEVMASVTVVFELK